VIFPLREEFAKIKEKKRRILIKGHSEINKGIHDFP